MTNEKLEALHREWCSDGLDCKGEVDACEFWRDLQTLTEAAPELETIRTKTNSSLATEPQPTGALRALVELQAYLVPTMTQEAAAGSHELAVRLFAVEAALATVEAKPVRCDRWGNEQRGKRNEQECQNSLATELGVSVNAICGIHGGRFQPALQKAGD